MFLFLSHFYGNISELYVTLPDFSKLVMRLSESKGIRSHYNQPDILLEAYICYEISGEVSRREGSHTFKLKSHIIFGSGCKNHVDV